MADNDLKRAITNSFPDELIQKLKGQLEEIKRSGFYENLKREQTKNRVEIKSNYSLERDTCLVHTQNINGSVLLLRLIVSSNGVFYGEGNRRSDQVFPIHLVSLDVQNKPLYPLLSKKLFQGILAWTPSAGESESQFRILMQLLNHNNELQQNAIYFSNFQTLQKVKNVFIIHSKKALHSNYFLKFLAVKLSDTLENSKL